MKIKPPSSLPTFKQVVPRSQADQPGTAQGSLPDSLVEPGLSAAGFSRESQRFERLLKLATIELTAEADDTPVRGNASASGDDAADLQVEDAIFDRLRDGDVWAWACVTVKASYRGYEGTSVVGGCTYEGDKEFKEGQDFVSMKYEACRGLADALESSEENLDELESTEQVREGEYAVASMNERGNLELRPTKDLRDTFGGANERPKGGLAQILEDFQDDFHWVRPEEIGALTDAPILAFSDEVVFDEKGNFVSAPRVFYYNEYALHDEVEEMLSAGMVVFTKHDLSEDAK